MDAMATRRDEFGAAGTYLDTATYGLPPRGALRELAAVTSAWADGSYAPVDCDDAVQRSRGRVSLASTFMASVDVEHDLASECVRITRRR